MKNPLLDWVLLIPWSSWRLFLIHFLLLLTTVRSGSAYENRFKSRGASLVNKQSQLQSQPIITRTLPAATYFYYDPITPVNVRQRRQRQFGADQTNPIVVLQTGRKTPATVQIKELPPLIRSRQVPPRNSGFFVQQQPSTTFTRFNQAGQSLFTLSSAANQNSIPPPPPVPAPAPIVENRFTPVVTSSTAVNLPQPEAVIGRLPVTSSSAVASAVPSVVPSAVPSAVPSVVPTVLQSKTTLGTGRTLFGGFASRSTTPSPGTTASASSTVSTASTFSQRPNFVSSTTTRFLRPARLTSSGTSSVFQR